jgi:uncharacterized protein YhaN
MRFALAERFTEKASLSLMMDEVLVNFDPERAKGVADVVTGLAKKHQVLMFTCHLESVELMTKLITGQPSWMIGVQRERRLQAKLSVVTATAR